MNEGHSGHELSDAIGVEGSRKEDLDWRCWGSSFARGDPPVGHRIIDPRIISLT
jgi:hypothetical protein